MPEGSGAGDDGLTMATGVETVLRPPAGEGTGPVRPARWFAPVASSRAVFAAATLLAHLPVLFWYGRRLHDGGDEPLGLVALMLALITTPVKTWREQLPAPAALAAAGVLAAGFVLAEQIPMLARALLLVVALAILLGHGAGSTARGALLALSLPVTTSLQFYLGYPLRVVAAELGRHVVAAGGVPVERWGVTLRWAGGDVVVDAPCSGLNMLWTSLVLAAGVAAWRRLPAGRTVGLLSVAVVAVILANALRVGLLFFVETGRWTVPGWFHPALALLLMLVLAAGLLTLTRGRPSEVGQATLAADGGRTAATGWMKIAHWTLGLLVAATGAAPWLATPGRAALTPNSGEVFPGWPELFEGRPWIRLVREQPLSAVLGAGALTTGVFRQDGRWVVLRWIREPSRQLHPAADCFRARGYEVGPLRLVRDDRGVTWSEFRAARAGESWRVRERFHDERGGEWTDVSAWYWSALRRSTPGPWWAVTEVAPEDGETPEAGAPPA